jgi:hypothetical protein
LDKLSQRIPDLKIFQAFSNLAQSRFLFWVGLMRYAGSFIAPYWSFLQYFNEIETHKAGKETFVQNSQDLVELLLFEMQLAARSTIASISAFNRYHARELKEVLSAIDNTLSGEGSEDLLVYSQRQLRIMDTLIDAYPRAIKEIEPEYGLHLDNGHYIKTAETDRFELYQVLPLDKGVEVREDGKPMIIVPPYVLGANILAFLPGENRSYVHAFANQGIPTYIRIVKDISKNPAVQLMTGEDDALDLKYFSEIVVAKHRRKLTLNGYCQGGFMSVVDLLSGQLDDLVDALITCAAPMDGSSSKSLVEYIEHLPLRFRDLGYAAKKLPNGNQVVDGKILSWVYKLKSIEQEAPFLSLYRDLMMFDTGSGHMPRISKTAAAISHWLTYDAADLPVGITRLSFDSYTKPVAEDGTLPVRLFGKPLNFRRIAEKGVNWLICIAENDDLVDAEASLRPLKFVDAEVAVFPKGHASIATSWSSPATECNLVRMNSSRCAIGSKYEERSANGKSRGPVRFHLELEEAEEKPDTFTAA